MNVSEAAREAHRAGIEWTYDHGGTCRIIETLNGQRIVRKTLTRREAQCWQNPNPKIFSLESVFPSHSAKGSNDG